MAETPADAPTSTEVGTEEMIVSETAAAIERKEITIRDLVEAGVHFGHQTRRWNPRMKSFLFGERNGIHIIDLDQTLPLFKSAIDFVTETVASGGKVLFVATKRQAQTVVQAESERAGQFYVNNRWLGGMLTNFKTVKKSIDRYKLLLEIFADEEKLAELSKKEQARSNRALEKYTKSLAGIKAMAKLPDAIVVIDVNREAIAIKEAQRLGIPIIAVVDSNCDPYEIEFAIPGNDDSIRAINLYATSIADACLEGSAIYNERAQSQSRDDEARAGKAEGGETTKTGRVVVEISQQPRRGKAAVSAEGREPRAEAAPAAAPAPTPTPTPAPAAAAAPEAEATPPAAPEGGD
jgi:small subunit ribosomal protein S2